MLWDAPEAMSEAGNPWSAGLRHAVRGLVFVLVLAFGRAEAQ